MDDDDDDDDEGIELKSEIEVEIEGRKFCSGIAVKISAFPCEPVHSPIIKRPAC